MNLKETAIGIELGSTRIKAVMIGRKHEVLAQGDYVWENSFRDGVWTYSAPKHVYVCTRCMRSGKVTRA